MKILTSLARIIVGVLFIISGFVKLNDPIGFSYKLQEYFAPEVLNLEFLSPFALGIAIILVIVEVVLGFALLIGYLKRFTLWMLLLLILFFTFLTFYSAYFNKVTDCGCFGDALPLTPWQSFTKDVVLLALILLLFFGQKYIRPLFTKFIRSVFIFIIFIGCLVFGYHVLMHLPWLDFRPYHEGANIAEGMKVPEGAQEEITDYHWRFEVNGEEKIITTRGDYPTVEGEFIDVETEIVQNAYQPPIHDFTIDKEGTDYTAQFLETEHLIMVIAYDIQKTEWNGWPAVKQKTDEAIKKGYTVIGLTASGPAEINELKEKQNLNFDFYLADATTLKTIVRSNPGILKLRHGTIVQKRHWNDVEEITLENLPEAKPKLDMALKRQLDSIMELDQKFRPLLQELDPDKRRELGQKLGMAPEDYEGDLYMRQRMVDRANLKYIKQLLDSIGYPGKNLVGEPTNEVAWNIIKHNPDQIPEYLDMMKKAGEAGELPYPLVATMEDKWLMDQGKEQLYGTQAQLTAANGMFIWPIKDHETVNQRRKDAGFELTIEEYAKELIGEDYEYKHIPLEDVVRL